MIVNAKNRIPKEPKTLLIRQPGGLGDILFMQKIFWHFHNAGYQVICPTLPGYDMLNEYIPWFNFPNENFFQTEMAHEYLGAMYAQSDDILTENFIYLNMYPRYLDLWYSFTLLIKYQFLNMDHSDWAKYIRINENKEKQIQLAKELKFDPNKRNILINRNFNHPYIRKMNILAATQFNILPTDNIVELDYVKGYTLFDWIYIFENIDVFIILESANTYIIEWLYIQNRLRATNYHIFQRDNHHYFVNEIFTNAPWKFEYV